MDVRMAVICWIFLGEKTGSISFKSKSLDRQISRSPASSFFGKSPGSFASIETAQDFEALIWNGFDEAKSLRMDEIVDLLSLKRIDLPRNYLGVKVHPMARFFSIRPQVPLETRSVNVCHPILPWLLPSRVACKWHLAPEFLQGFWGRKFFPGHREKRQSFAVSEVPQNVETKSLMKLTL